VPLGLNVPITAEHCTGCHKKEGNPTAGDDYEFDFDKFKDDEDAIHAHEPLKYDHAD